MTSFYLQQAQMLVKERESIRKVTQDYFKLKSPAGTNHNKAVCQRL